MSGIRQAVMNWTWAKFAQRLRCRKRSFNALRIFVRSGLEEFSVEERR